MILLALSSHKTGFIEVTPPASWNTPSNNHYWNPSATTPFGGDG